jgi:hypothetical protein
MNRRNILIIVIVVAVFFIGGGSFVYARYLGPQTVLQTSTDNEHCRQGSVLAGAGRESRFTVLSTCEKVVGVVHDVKGTKEDDGDYQFNLDVEEPYKRLLNEENNNRWHGMLVIEIIPRDQGSSSVQIPKNGDRIEVYGAWVTDNAYLGMPYPPGWNEIHPAWSVKILGQ